jgi:uncharacterized protein (DUF58 family)
MISTESPLPSFSPAKDPADFPLFKGQISRAIWRIYTQRLTRAGRWFAVATAALFSYGGASSMQLQSFVPAGYVAALWWIALMALLLYRPKVKLWTQLSSRTSVGEILPVDVEVEQHGALRGADLVVMPHRLPLAIDSVPEEGIALPDLRRGQKAKVRLGLRCHKRGKHLFHGFRVESGFPFGLLRSRKVFYQQHAILVYPNFTPLARLALPTGRRYQPGGVALASELGESFEYLGNREYRDGDNVRDIDWRATARVQRPIVREWVEEYMLRVAVILDTHVPQPSKQGKIDRADAFERAVSVAAAVSDYMARQDYLVDLFAAGPNLYHLTAGRSLAYLDQILDILACVEANPNEPFEIIEPQMAELLSRISTVICVFLDWNETRRSFVQRMQAQGAAVKVIIMRDGSCTLDPMDDARGLGQVPVISKPEFDRGIDEL